MKVSTCFATIAIVVAPSATQLAAAPAYAAEIEGRDIHTLIEANKNACRDLDSRQLRGLKLAAKAAQGIQQFVRFVQFNRPHREWTSEEAVKLAKTAAVAGTGICPR